MRKIPVIEFERLQRIKDLCVELEATMSDYVDKAKEYYEDRSTKWKESGASSAYEEWMDQMESVKEFSAELRDSIDALSEKPIE